MVTAVPERLELPGLMLRRRAPGDARTIADAVAINLEHLAVWMTWATAEAGTVEVQAARSADSRREWADGQTYEFVALDPGSDRFLGMFGLHRRIGPGAIELGYWLCTDATGHGHATTAAAALTSVALTLPDVDRVEIHCDPANAHSRRIPERLGFRLDRTVPSDVEAPGQSGRTEIWVSP